MFFDLFFQKFEIKGAFAAADDLAVAFGREQVCPKREFRSFLVAFKIKFFDDGRDMMNKNGRVKLF
jgi:hypothetical protein